MTAYKEKRNRGRHDDIQFGRLVGSFNGSPSDSQENLNVVLRPDAGDRPRSTGKGGGAAQRELLHGRSAYCG